MSGLADRIKRVAYAGVRRSSECVLLLIALSLPRWTRGQHSHLVDGTIVLPPGKHLLSPDTKSNIVLVVVGVDDMPKQHDEDFVSCVRRGDCQLELGLGYCTSFSLALECCSWGIRTAESLFLNVFTWRPGSASSSVRQPADNSAEHTRGT
jgi:hypothetical protein